MSETQKELPAFTKYTDDSFKDLSWKWEWQINGSNWTINNLRLYCPTCNTRMQYSVGGLYDYADCPNCKKHLTYADGLPSYRDVELLILDKAEKTYER